jgi:hypothetical protein
MTSGMGTPWEPTAARICRRCYKSPAMCECYGHVAQVSGGMRVNFDATFRNPMLNGVGCNCPGAVREAHGSGTSMPRVHRCPDCDGGRFDLK